MVDRLGLSRSLRVAVVGGGISGLAAAWGIARESPGTEVVVYESDRQSGGKLRVSELAGIPLDEGAESMLALRPEAVALAREAGLATALTNPVTTQASVYARGRLRPLPTGMVSGVPTDLRALAASGIVSLPGLLRIPFDHWLPRAKIESDLSLGALAAARLGPEVLNHLVDPMVAGVYAGRAQELSLDMTAPVLFRLLRKDRSLLAAAREARRASAVSAVTKTSSAAVKSGPAFVGLTGGVGRLPIALTQRLRDRGVVVEADATVTGLSRTALGWRLAVNAGRGLDWVDFDAVVLAVQAKAAANLLRHANPAAAARLGGIEYASVAVVAFLFESKQVPPNLHGSGFLVPAGAGFAVKAATYSSRKWGWLSQAAGDGEADHASTRGRESRRGGLFAVRVSLGRFGDDIAESLDDQKLIQVSLRDLSKLAGFDRKPIASRVTRWPQSLPQYLVGHRARVAAVRESLVDSAGLVVCGAAYDGIGIPACIGSAQFGAGQVLAYLREKERWANGQSA